MARWALSPVIGSGTYEDPYRAKAADHGGHVTVIPGNADGTPMYPWCVVKFFDDADMVAAAADGDIRVLPAWSLDHPITAGEAAAIEAAGVKFGLSPPDATGHTVRQVLRWFADQLDVTWDVG